MVYNFSLWVDRVHPDLRGIIEDTSAVARWLDPNIPYDGVLINARRFPGGEPDDCSGMAYGWDESFVGYGDAPGEWTHPEGRIDLRLGPRTSQEDKIRLVAHELRHLGQYQCGNRQWGEMILLLRRETCENDAYAFEDVVLDTMRSREGK